MQKIMVLVMVVGSFWAGLVWADMERVSTTEGYRLDTQITHPVSGNK